MKRIGSSPIEMRKEFKVKQLVDGSPSAGLAYRCPSTLNVASTSVVSYLIVADLNVLQKGGEDYFKHSDM